MQEQMNKQCRILSNFSKKPLSTNLEMMVKAIHTLCENRCTVEIKLEEYIRCSICNRTGGNNVKLFCNHVVHRECLESQARKLTNDTFDPSDLLRLKCSCGKMISEKECIKILGRNKVEGYRSKANEKLMEDLTKKDNQERKRVVENLSFTCQLCLGQTKMSQGITLCQLDHRMCKTCVGQNIQEQIKQGNHNEIKCNFENCEELLAEHLIKFCINEQQYDKLVSLQHKSLKCEGLNFRQCGGYIYKDNRHLVEIEIGTEGKKYNDLQDQLQTKCAAIQSGNAKQADLTGQVQACPAIIGYDPRENRKGGILQCTVCGLDCCIKGCSSAHRGNTCAKYKEWEETNKKGTNLAFAEIRALGMAQCQNPKCMMPILRAAGCNWVKCRCGFQICYPCSGPWVTGDPHVGFGGHKSFDVAKFLATH